MTASGMPRSTIEDDEYRGYKFEKGTVFTYNNFGISHNEEEYPQNEVFKPERFLNADLQDMLKGHLGFGAGTRTLRTPPERAFRLIIRVGRRICPGWHLGTRNMFIVFARLLYCFRFEEVPGEPIDDCRIDPLAHNHPPFSIKILPRSQAHVDLIERECASAATDF